GQGSHPHGLGHEESHRGRSRGLSRRAHPAQAFRLRLLASRWALLPIDERYTRTAPSPELRAPPRASPGLLRDALASRPGSDGPGMAGLDMAPGRGLWTAISINVNHN